MIQTPAKQMPWSLLIPSSSLGPRSSSIGSTTSVGDSKEALHLSVASSLQSEDRRPIKKVEFNQTVRAKLVPSRHRLTKHERSSMWYDSEECMAIRQSALHTVQKMTRNETVDMDSNDCSRGLEGRTPKQDKLRQERRRMIIGSVLTEQLETDQYDYETSSQVIAAAYILCNQSCSFEAVRRGELDAIEAKHS